MDFMQLAPGSLKANLSLYLPALLEIIVQKDFNWKKIEKLLSIHLNERIVQLHGRESMTVKAHLVDIIIEAKKGNSKAVGLLDFLNKVCEELSVNLPKRGKELLRGNIRQMLTAFDHRYLDFVGELAVLNNLIKSKLYKLEGVEKRTPNSRPIDFELRSVSTQKLLYAEIVSIHINPDRVEDNPESIERFINGRLIKKINEKTIDLNRPTVYHLVPVVWGGKTELEVYSKFFQTNKLKIINVLEPSAFLMQTDGQRYYRHRFGRLSGLFELPVE